MNDIKEFQNSIKLLRSLAGWTAEELGEKIGSTRQTINNLEGNKTSLTKTMYIALKSAFTDEVTNNSINCSMLKSVFELIIYTPTSISPLDRENLITDAKMLTASMSSGYFSKDYITNEWFKRWSNILNKFSMNTEDDFWQKLKNEIAPLLSSIFRASEEYICDELSSVMYVVWKKPDQILLNSILGDNSTIEYPIVNGEVIEQKPSVEEIDKALEKYLISNKYAPTSFAIDECNILLHDNPLWAQALSSYNRKEYHAAIIVFSVLLDNLLSTTYDNSKETSSKKRITNITTKYDQRVDKSKLYDTIYLTKTLSDSIILYNKNYDFGKPEPSFINRNWLLHGRSTRFITQYDCSKLIHMIYGILLINQALNS